MKIKGIEIFGFKSFFDKTSLSFLPGITAMVGPNGCGKSNIVDAIRWSLGEQSAKHLRGSSMEDVIFNGSRSKKALGMAEVSLTFANDNGHAPIQYRDYPEIQITRRVFRSGESEYFINKTPCRLKDITELFLDTGVGSRAYSIIEQGRVDSIINAKPGDLRTLIEEAAGISKYKARKAEALRKMDLTRQNLVRVNDLLNEIQKQINSLKYQAQKLKRFKGLKDRIRTLDLAVASQKYHRLSEARSQKQSELEELKDRQSRLQTDIETITADNFTKSNLLHEEDEKFSVIQGKKYEIEYAIREEENTIETAREKIEDLDRLTSRAKRETGENQERLEQEQTAVTEAIALKKKLHDQVSSGDILLREKEEKLQEIKQSYDVLRTDLERQREELFELRNELTRRDNLIERAEQTRAECGQRIEQNRRESEEGKTALEELRRSHAVIQEDLAQRRQERQSLENQEQTHRRTIAALEQDLHRLSDTMAHLKETQARCESLLESLKELQKNFEGCSDGVRSIMQRSETAAEENRGIVGLLADLVETEPRYEAAVESVLGEKLQYVVVHNQSQGLDAIDYLKSESLGRASFVPVEDVKPLIAAGHDRENSPATPLASVVKAKEGYETMVRYLLGDTLVVENLSHGLDLWRSNAINGSTLVTVDGDIIDPLGIITGGAQSGTGSGFLKKKREIAELEEKCLVVADDLETACKDHALKLQALENSRQALKDIQERLMEQKLTFQNRERDLHQTSEEIQRTERKVEFLRITEQKIGSELQEIVADLEQHTYDREELKTAYAARQETFSDLQQRETTERERIEREQATFNQDKLDLTDKKAQLSNLSSTLSLREQTIATCLSEIEKYSRAQEEATEERFDLERKIEAARVRMEDLTTTFQRYRGELEEQENRVNAQRLAVQQGEERVKEVQRSFNRLQPAILDLDREHSEVASQLRRVEEKIADKYHVMLKDVIADYPSEDYPEEETETKLEKLATAQERMIEGINFNAEREYDEQAEKFEFYQNQSDDLNNSLTALQEAINKINRTSRERFREAYGTISGNFKKILPLVFEGGQGELHLTDEHDMLETGVEIKVQPAGKSLKSISLMSGGEKALSAISLLFALYLYKPSPFCLLDEVDSPLDDANVYRFANILKQFSSDSQFLVITHNKHTMEVADMLYGITMEEPGISKIVSVQLREEEEEIEEAPADFNMPAAGNHEEATPMPA